MSEHAQSRAHGGRRRILLRPHQRSDGGPRSSTTKITGNDLNCGARWLSGRMPEHGFNFRLCYRFEDWASLLSPQRPSSLSCINEYMDIDRSGNVRD